MDYSSYPEVPSLNSKPGKLIVFLHGVGADGYDLIDLAPYFQKELPDAHFISPHGIEPYDSEVFGRQWFSLSNRSPDIIWQLLEKNAPKVQAIISSAQQRLDLSNQDTILVGFSQGTMMGLHLTLAQDDPFTAMIAFSGRLFPPKHLKNSNTPICTIHGAEDKIVPPSYSDELMEYCNKNNIYCKKLIIPNLSHSIDLSGLNYAIEFLKENKSVKDY